MELVERQRPREHNGHFTLPHFTMRPSPPSADDGSIVDCDRVDRSVGLSWTVSEGSFPPQEEYVDHNPQLDKILSKMSIDEKALKRAMKKMAGMMDRGLANDPSVVESSSLKMLPSFVYSLPDGTETGDHLALDLGGTNFRVLVISLHPNRRAQQDSKIYSVPNRLMIGTSEMLFDHIADCLANFVQERGIQGRVLPLGFTFSFPCEQHDLTEAHLISWTKGYKASGVEGHDVVQLLRDAIKRRSSTPIQVMAVLNDTVGTLMALAHEEPECEIGIILGTGTNACYMEKKERAPKLQECLAKAGFDQMAINMEWGGFGDMGELDDLRTEFDLDVDRNSINPGKQIFEKMISGLYMGEVTRRILLKLVSEGLIFEGRPWKELITKDRFYPHYISDIVSSTMAASDGKSSFYKVRQVLNDFGLVNASPQDCANIAHVSSIVVKRSADLCAAGIATLLNRMMKARMTVGIDGSVYRFNQPYFHKVFFLLPLFKRRLIK